MEVLIAHALLQCRDTPLKEIILRAANTNAITRASVPQPTQEHTGTRQPHQVSHRPVNPNMPGCGTNPMSFFPRLKECAPAHEQNRLMNSLIAPLGEALEQSPCEPVFRPVNCEVHAEHQKPRKKSFIYWFFHPNKYLVHRKVLKAVKAAKAAKAEAAENIKGMLATPTIFMIDGSYDVLNKGLLSDFAQFIAAGKTLQPKQNRDGAKDDYTTQCRALGTLLRENTPVEMLLDETLTEGWRTVLPAFAEFAKDFRLRVAPCIGLTAKFMEAIQLSPGEFLSECIPDWSIRFDEKATTAMENAPCWLTPRLEAYLSEAKQRLQALDNSRVIHF